MTDEKYWAYQRRISAAKTVEAFDDIAEQLKQEDPEDSDVTDLGEQLMVVRSVTFPVMSENGA